MPAETVHLFLNPAAGRGRAKKREPRIRELLEAGSFPLEVHLSRGVGDLEEQVCRHVISEGSQGYRDLSPAEYVAFAKQWHSLGATIIGGCCGKPFCQ